MRKLALKEQQKLFPALSYLNTAEIKAFCLKYQIPLGEKKGAILKRIKHFLLTSEILQPKKLPALAKAEKGELYPLKPSTLILKGAYKNDLKTRKFFQQIIGEHFHFTAFGQDWILMRWQAGKPPTYAQFAKFWQQEYKKRQNAPANPKQEWAYLNFLQQYQKKRPAASRREMTQAWDKERAAQAIKAKKMLEQRASYVSRKF